MKSRDFNRTAFGIGLNLMLASTAIAQVAGTSTNNPLAAVRTYIDAFNKVMQRRWRRLSLSRDRP